VPRTLAEVHGKVPEDTLLPRMRMEKYTQEVHLSSYKLKVS